MHVEIVDYVFELAQNSVESGADMIDLRLSENDDGVVCEISDNGCGMNAAQLAGCRDPYATVAGKHVGRKLGLGLALLSQLLCSSDGSLDIYSTPGTGTRLKAWFNKRHLDTPPLGDPVELFLDILCFEGEFDMRIERLRANGAGGHQHGYELLRSAIIEVIGNPGSAVGRKALRCFLRQQEDMLPG